MGLFSSNVKHPYGLTQGEPEKVRVTMRGSAGNKGQIVYFDLASSDGGTTASTKFGGKTNPTANVILATASQNGSAANTMFLCGILAENIADDAEGYAYIRGVVQALGGDTSAAGVGLTAGTGSELVAITNDTRCFAVALETMADATLKWVAFDGINGFAKTGQNA